MDPAASLSSTTILSTFWSMLSLVTSAASAAAPEMEASPAALVRSSLGVLLGFYELVNGNSRFAAMVLQAKPVARQLCA